jgi:hypothetical protein
MMPWEDVAKLFPVPREEAVGMWKNLARRKLRRLAVTGLDLLRSRLPGRRHLRSSGSDSSSSSSGGSWK